jgi:NAD(P)H-dependent flavin oxidoreductase YrpB (nitropropane dioxygenase family)
MRIASVRVEHPIVQAGLGGGLARHGLAAAVSGAGGLGTLGMLSPADLRREILATKAETTKPIAVNILLPFVRAGHWEAAEAADVVVTFWGRPERHTARPWVHQSGSVEEAVAARDAGADGVIVQGIEAGGHVRGDLPALELLSQARHALPAGFPILVAGGIATAADVRTALDAGADGAVLGTRFLMSEESRAHAAYKERLLGAQRTVLTDLFGLGWPARHRVVPNAATARWGDRIPSWMHAMHRVTGSMSHVLPMSGAGRLAALQRPWFPLLSPKSATVDDAPSLVDSGPLYAGETVLRIHDLPSASSIVRALTA